MNFLNVRKAEGDMVRDSAMNTEEKKKVEFVIPFEFIKPVWYLPPTNRMLVTNCINVSIPIENFGNKI